MADSDSPTDCGEQFDISAVADLYAVLSDALDRGQPVVLDGSRVGRIDTAGVQMLTAFIREAQGKGIRVDWQGTTEVLCEAAQRLGLAQQLALP